MKRTLAALSLILAGSAAQAGLNNMPILIFPDFTPPPVTQDCTDLLKPAPCK